MRKVLKSAVVAAAVALAALAATVPASAAMESSKVNPATEASPLTTKTGLNVNLAWVHFLPTLTSDHLTVYQGDNLDTICYLNYGGYTWNIVLDNNTATAGYTFASALTNPSVQWCGNVGSAAGVYTQTWVHLYPQANLEHQVVNPGDDIAAVCDGTYYDPTDGSVRVWDLVLDHRTNMTGWTWASAVTRTAPAACP